MWAGCYTCAVKGVARWAGCYTCAVKGVALSIWARCYLDALLGNDKDKMRVQRPANNDARE